MASFSEFRGNLPFDLVFSDDRGVLAMKLGKPRVSLPNGWQECWGKRSFWVVVNYNEAGTIRNLMVGLHRR